MFKEYKWFHLSTTIGVFPAAPLRGPSWYQKSKVKGNAGHAIFYGGDPTLGGALRKGFLPEVSELGPRLFSDFMDWGGPGFRVGRSLQIFREVK